MGPPDRLVKVDAGEIEFVSDFCVLELTTLKVSNCFPVVALDSTDCCLSSLGLRFKLEIISLSISVAVSSVLSTGSSVIIAPPDEVDVVRDKGIEIVTGIISELFPELLLFAGKTTKEFVVVPVSELLVVTGITTERMGECVPRLTEIY